MKITLVALALCAGASTAAAGTLAGTITGPGGPVAGAEVRIWQNGAKGWSIAAMTTTNAGGAYSFAVIGTVRVDARVPAGTNLGDRWYDVAPPTASGYVGDAADDVNVPVNGTVTADLALELMGGADATLVRANGGAPVPSAFVRLERRADPRIHHNDVTDVAPSGVVAFRGVPPAADYQIIAYDPTGARETLLAAGPYTVTQNANGMLGALMMADAGVDPAEGNNTPNCGVGFDPAPLHMDPPQPWQSANARIGPTTGGGDVDWYCFAANLGDRLFVSTSTEFTFGGASRYHPWTDPMISFWRGARSTLIASDDDSGVGPLDAKLDTGPLQAGCHCVAVTTFGDSDFRGANQGSSGRYTLKLVMGNRAPAVSIKKGVTEVPAAPTILYMDEGDTLALTLGYADADHDVPGKAFTHVDAMNQAVAGGNLVLGAAGGMYTWTAPMGSEVGSPYVLSLTASDNEFTIRKDVLVVVNGVNRGPTTPTPTMPTNGDPVANGAPALTWTNSTDPEGEALSYDVELYYGDTDRLPDQTGTVAELAGGSTSWTPSTVPENTKASWRVRARDGHPNGISPWSPFARFLVDVANDAPDAPVLIKPAAGEVAATRRPGLSVLDVDDPEEDDVSMVFQIASDTDFTQMAWTSDPVPMNTMAVSTMASTGVDLAWGHTYYARAKAQDDRGGVSDWSDVHQFELAMNVPPTTPSFAEECVAAIYKDAAPTGLTVTNVVDHEGEPVTFEVQFFTYDADPNTGIPIYRTTAPMDAAAQTTTIPIDLSSLPNGSYRYRVRAHDGSDPSDWIGCELTLDLSADGGGCCDAGRGPAGTALPMMLFGLGVLRRRRRLAAIGK